MADVLRGTEFNFAACPPTIRWLELRDSGLTGRIDAALWRGVRSIRDLQSLDISMNSFSPPVGGIISLAPLQEQQHGCCCFLEELSIGRQSTASWPADTPGGISFDFASCPPSLLRLNASALGLRGDIVRDVLARLPVKQREPRSPKRRASRKSQEPIGEGPELPAAPAMECALDTLILIDNRLCGNLSSIDELPLGLRTLVLRTGNADLVVNAHAFSLAAMEQRGGVTVRF